MINDHIKLKLNSVQQDSRFGSEILFTYTIKVTLRSKRFSVKRPSTLEMGNDMVTELIKSLNSLINLLSIM